MNAEHITNAGDVECDDGIDDDVLGSGDAFQCIVQQIAENGAKL